MGLSINLKIIQQLEWIYGKLFLSFLNTRSVKLSQAVISCRPHSDIADVLSGPRSFGYRLRKLIVLCIGDAITFSF